MTEETNSSTKEPFIIAIPIYDDVDLMDIAAPREIFHWLSTDESFNRDVRIYYIGENDTFRTIGGVEIQTDKKFDDELVQHPNLIWVPGGEPAALAIILDNPDSPYTAYVKRAGENAEWVCSVCEGAILLANTGLLDGHTITTHWAFVNCFGKYPKVNVISGNPRYVKSENRVTGGGISSGLDEALFLVELIAGTASAIGVQQMMQYYPDPPVQSEIPTSSSCPVPGIE
ncbi:MAG: DJ-1/PfpI family protein [Crocinitomicaceae bacterium]|nr:DJ-1/PfpI family protein [Flavobacteriales bacterium]NQZ35300.1 DJ-1/PfpI family protein [Crocinitomicaceae bacterium]